MSPIQHTHRHTQTRCQGKICHLMRKKGFDLSVCRFCVWLKKSAFYLQEVFFCSSLIFMSVKEQRTSLKRLCGLWIKVRFMAVCPVLDSVKNKSFFLLSDGSSVFLHSDGDSRRFQRRFLRDAARQSGNASDHTERESALAFYFIFFYFDVDAVSFWSRMRKVELGCQHVRWPNKNKHTWTSVMCETCHSLSW